MASIAKQAEPPKVAERRGSSIFKVWNRKLHYYIGLYLLFFLWLFSFTGLLLNHGQWAFAEFWPNRKQTKFERQVKPPAAGSDLVKAKAIARELDLRGEIEWPSPAQQPGQLAFRVIRPGTMFDVQADLSSGRVILDQTKINFWGIIRVLHTFTGVRLGDPAMKRDWAMTTAWALSMDALAAGLILMVFSSFYMWYGLPRKRLLGLIALSLGIVCCGFFVFGLGWLY